MSGSSIRWAICKSALFSRQITTPEPHHPFCCPTNSVKALQAQMISEIMRDCHDLTKIFFFCFYRLQHILQLLNFGFTVLTFVLTYTVTSRDLVSVCRQTGIVLVREMTTMLIIHLLAPSATRHYHLPTSSQHCRTLHLRRRTPRSRSAT